MFIMIDGIDGSGKSTILTTWKNACKEKNLTIFDLKEYWIEHQTFPTFEEISHADVLFSAEPTSAWIGKGIREEMIANGSNYSPMAIATAYSLDRLLLYTRIHIPFLEQGKMIIQDRGISTSLCYQSLQGDLTMETIASLEGNSLAIIHRPDHLFLTEIPVAIAMERLGVRHDKQDNALFEKHDFLQKAQETFHSKNYQEVFLNKGTTIHTLNTNRSLDIMQEEALRVFTTLL